MSCINTPGFLTLCTSKGSFMSKAVYSTTSGVHNSGHEQASTGRSYLQRVCVMFVPRAGSTCMSGLLSHSPIALTGQNYFPVLLSCLSSHVAAPKVQFPRGGQIPKLDLLLTSAFALTRFMCLIRSSFIALFMIAGKRWTLYIRITASNEVIKTWLRVRLWFCVRPPCMLWWLLDELLPVWCIP